LPSAFVIGTGAGELPRCRWFPCAFAACDAAYAAILLVLPYARSVTRSGCWLPCGGIYNAVPHAVLHCCSAHIFLFLYRSTIFELRLVLPHTHYVPPLLPRHHLPPSRLAPLRFYRSVPAATAAATLLTLVYALLFCYRGAGRSTATGSPRWFCVPHAACSFRFYWFRSGLGSLVLFTLRAALVCGL